MKGYPLYVQLVLSILIGLTFVGLAKAESVEVEHLPSVFDDGTHIPEKIEWTTWEETDLMFPRNSTFEVVDIETGLYFTVQRRAGSHHADVQPLTKTDTAIMKEIYDGTWSWKRRGIFIRNGSEMIPASMHGMPHGAGALQNNFPGHFCIHLPNSTTHKSNKEDPSHQLMILKAAGKLDDYINNATSEQLANVFIHALNQEDYTILSKTTNHPVDKNTLRKLFFVHPDHPLSKKEPSTLLVTEYSVEVLTRSERGLDRDFAILRLERKSLTDHWSVDLDSLFQKD